MKPVLTISMLCLNRLELTQACVESIKKHTSVPHELRIWDNGSTDGTPEYLKALVQRYPEIVFVTRVEKNAGFIKPHNFQARAAEGQYVCILNNDVEVDPGWAEALLAPFERDPSVGATGPVDDYGQLSNEFVGMQGNPYSPVEYLSGHALMVPKAVIEDHGLFDEEGLTWATCEDSDFSLRIRRAGYRIVVVPEAKITHIKRATMDHVSTEQLGYDPVANELRNRRAMQKRWAEYLRMRKFDALRILVCRDGALGDVLCVEPILRALRRKYLGCHLTLLSQMDGAVKDCPVLNRVTSAPQVKQEPCDLTFDLNLAYERRPKVHMVRAYADVCGVREPGRPQFHLNREGQLTAAQLPTDRPLAVIASEGSWPIRQWPKERFAEVARWLTRWFRVVEVGNERAALGVGWNLCGKTSLQQLAAVYSQASLAVMCDSLHVHLAACFEVPTVGIWGGTDPRLRIYGPEHHPVKRADFPCVGCHHDREAPRCHSGCDQGAFRGMQVPLNGCMDIPVMQVMDAIDRLIAKGGE